METGKANIVQSIEELRRAHKVLAQYSYPEKEVQRGYAGRTLYVNLSTREIKEKPVTREMKEKFTGGRGFGLKLLWEGVNETTRWDDPENEIIITTGPLCGTTQYPGTGKSLCLTISPLTNIVVDSNVGGFFGPYLKFSGFDALEIQGKAGKDVVLVIDGQNHRVTIEEAPKEAVNTHLLADQLTRMYAGDDSPRAKQKVSVVSSGEAAEHSFFGCLNFSFYDLRRKVARVKQAGRGGLGTVFRNKKIKALVVRAPSISGISNHPADPDTLARVGTKLHREIRDLDRQQCNMRTTGTPHLVEIMDAYDLLPVENYRFGSHPKTPKISSPVWYRYFTQIIPDGCWFGCTLACSKAVDGHRVMTGPYKGSRVSVDGPEYETVGCGSNMGIFVPEWILEFNFYCDTYGLDTISAGTLLAFVMECYEYGILNKERCDGMELCFGNGDAVLEFLHRIARGEGGFSAVAARGIRHLKGFVIQKGWGDPDLIENMGMEAKGLEYSEYVSKESLAQQGGYGLTLKGPQHDEAWLIFMDMVNNALPTFEDKAEALHYFPMWRTWFGLNGLCKLPWNDIEPADNAHADNPSRVPEHVQNYVELFRAVTGREDVRSGKDLILQSERCYNFQRAFAVRLGRGRRKDDWAPYRSMGPVTALEYQSREERYDKQLKEKLGVDPEKLPVEEKVKILRKYRENEYQKLASAVYRRRGWTQNGVPTPEKMRELKMDFPEVIEVLQRAIAQDEASGLNG